MFNKFLDHGLQEDKKKELPNEDFKQGFLDAVRNNQPGLALTYLTAVLNEIVGEIKSVAGRLGTIEEHLFGDTSDDGEPDVEEPADVPVVEEPVEAESVAKKPRRTSTAKQVANESESQD